MSHPTWVRGLKHQTKRRDMPVAKSHPTWVRGLKPTDYLSVQRDNVAPYVGAWIETNKLVYTTFYVRSHPTWVRGLKPKVWYNRGFGMSVAPYVGAWIETY